MRILCVLTALCLPLLAAASGAYPYPLKVRQADGSLVTIVMHGDEFCGWATDMQGRLMVKGSDGFWRSSGQVDVEKMKAVRAENLKRYSEDLSDMLPLTKGNAPVTDVNVLVIPVQFSDVKFSIADYRAYLYDKLNTVGYSLDGATGSARDYFEANFPGYTFTFDVADVVTLEHNEDYYGANDESVPSVIKYDANISKMVREACTEVNAQLNYGKYDQDGDGKVDHLVFVYAGYNEAEGGGRDAIWSHEWDVTNYRMIFDGKQIGLYGCSSELRGATGTLQAGIGTFCHELSHTFGLKDMYDVDYGKDGTSVSLWRTLSVMDYGNFNNDGKTPPYYSAIDREQAGIVEIKDMVPGGNIELLPVYDGGSVYRLDTDVPGEYFLFEARRETGWDSFIGGHGMLVYHIDKSDSIVSGITASVRWQENLINTVPEHECADLVEAQDGASDISQVFFPGQGMVEEFGPLTIPALESWDSESIGIRLSGIHEDGGSVVFSVSEDLSEKILHVIDPVVVPYQEDAHVSWKSEKTGNSWHVRWRRPDDPAFSDTVVNRLEADMTGLKPDSYYRCEIFHIGKKTNGDTVTVSFSTVPFTSVYPYIHSVKKLYEQYDDMILKVQNVQEEVRSVEWRYDDRIVLGGTISLTDPGRHKIEAVITYSSDGTKETITRYITVIEKEESE